MLLPTAEESYRKGVAALVSGHGREALARFEASIEIERRRNRERPQPRYLSFYGLCLALERNEIHEGLRYCREAVTLESFNADIRCNLGRVLLRAGRKREAYKCLLQGLRLDPGHAEIVEMVKKMGIRRRPVVWFLARSNPINVFLGRLLSAV